MPDIKGFDVRPRVLVFLAVFIPAAGLLFWLTGGVEPESRSKSHDGKSTTSTATKPPPPKPPGQTEASAGNFQYPRYENDRLVFEAEGKSVKVLGEERVEVQDPRVTYYYYDPKRPGEPLVAKIIASSGVIDKRQDLAELSGGVWIAVSDGSLVETEYVISHFKARDISTEKRVRLVRGGMTLAGTGLTADVRLEHLEFLRDAEAVLSGRPETLVDLTRAAPMEAPAPGEAAESIEIRSAGPMLLDRRPPSESEPFARHHLTFKENVRVARRAGGGEGTMTCEALALDLLERPAAAGDTKVALAFEKAKAEGQVTADSPEGKAYADTLDIVYAADGTRDVTLSGGTPTVTLADGGGFRLLPPKALAAAAPPSGQAPPHTGPEPVTISCRDPIRIAFPPPANEGAPPRAGSATFAGAVRVESRAHTLNSDRLEVLFHPPDSKAAAVASKARIETMTATGHVRGKSEGVDVTSDSLEWKSDETLILKGTPAVLVQPDGRISAREVNRQSDGTLILEGTPAEVTQPDSRISANRLEAQPDRGSLKARGAVEATFTPREGDEGGPQFTMGPEGTAPESPDAAREPMTLRAESMDVAFSGEPREVVSLEADTSVRIGLRRQTAVGDHFKWTRAENLSLLTGTPASISEGETRVEAQWILADPDAHRVTLRGRKRLTIVRSIPPPPGRPDAAPSAEHFVADCRGTLMVLRGLGRIEFEEEVRLQSDTTTLECDHLVALLGPDGQTVERLLATGQVRITDPHGMATGDQVRWQLSDQSLLVRGLPMASAWKGPDVLQAEDIRIDRNWQRVVATNRFRRVEVRVKDRVEAGKPK